MSVPYWKIHEPADDTTTHEPARPVDEQHALPVGIYVKPDDNEEAEEVTLTNPLPTRVREDVQSGNIRALIPAPVAVSQTTTTLIVPANPARRSVLITQVTGAQLVYLHIDDDVSTTRYGTILTAAVGSSVTFYCKDAIWGLAATAAQTVGVWEEYASA